MGIDELLEGKRDEILRTANQHGAHSIRVFGSVARGEAGPDSDIDFLVEMEDGRSLLDLGRLLVELQDLLGRRVDIVEPEGLRWYVRDRILEEAVPL
jgi:uncharacterized protein